MATIYSTSHSIYSIQSTIANGHFRILSIPYPLSNCDLMIFVSDLNGNNYDKKIYPKGQIICCDIPHLHDGIYCINIYYKPLDQNLFWSYLSKSQLLFSSKAGVLNFVGSPIHLKNNVWMSLFFKRNIANPNFLSNCSSIQVNDSRIKTLANNITKNKLLPYTKVLAIHDWIAENISYDYDSLNDGSYIEKDSSALGTLLNKRGVCQGYTNLSVALLRSINIPSTQLTCFSLGISSSGGWENKLNLESQANHVITAAYVSNRWVLMDVTWDSDNIYENGKYGTKTGLGISHLYFDPTIAFISNTHRFTI